MNHQQEEPLGLGDDAANNESLTQAEKKLLMSELNLSPDAIVNDPNNPQTMPADDEQKFVDALDAKSIARQIFLKGFRIEAGMATNEEILKEHPEVVDPAQQQKILDEWRIAAGEWTDEEVIEALGG